MSVLLNADPPLKCTPKSLSRAKARLYFRIDNVLLRLLQPFAQALSAFEAQTKQAATQDDYINFALGALKSFRTVTLKEAAQWGIASWCLWTEQPFLKQVAYQFDMYEKLKAYYISNALMAVGFGRRACRLLIGSFEPPAEEDLKYDDEADPAKKTIQRLVIASFVNWAAALVSLMDEARAIADDKRRKKHAVVGFAKYTVQSVFLFAARVAGAVVGSFGGPTGIILADFCVMPLCVNANPFIAQFVNEQVGGMLEA